MLDTLILISDSLAEQRSAEAGAALREISRLDAALETYFRTRLSVEPSLSRQLVSFQANKLRPVYRWYKYKEAFSAALVEYLFSRYSIRGGRLLDPFAGSGTALFAASSLGLDADGIELLPIGQTIIETRLLVERNLYASEIVEINDWLKHRAWQQFDRRGALPELRITSGAYPAETRTSIERYLGALEPESPQVAAVLRFALLCVLESVSYTRKDGQYLRWDYRSGRNGGAKKFDKGHIAPFDEAVLAKISEIVADLETDSAQLTLLSNGHGAEGRIRLQCGSCLDILPKLDSESFDVLVTSPPYCNRYDYTRTYALELAALGVSERELVALRQNMLSCTVENRAKDLLAINPLWRPAIDAADSQPLLQAILSYLDQCKARGELNNNGIPRMVRGYFYEMTCVVSEAFRVMKPGAILFMVNDNVRYAGASISVDLILSAIAEALGFDTERILVLPTGKGNSSQQMGAHGRESLRKCVYVWRKP